MHCTNECTGIQITWYNIINKGIDKFKWAKRATVSICNLIRSSVHRKVVCLCRLPNQMHHYSPKQTISVSELLRSKGQTGFHRYYWTDSQLLISGICFRGNYPSSLVNKLINLFILCKRDRSTFEILVTGVVLHHRCELFMQSELVSELLALELGSSQN